MKNTLIKIFLFMFFPLCAVAQQKVKGYVFIDKDNNGIKTKNEVGIPGVAVSNGRDVVLADKNGAYELPLDDDDIIFVVKPSGYQFPLTSEKLPKFYYIHKPQGSPSTLKFKGVAPTGRLPKSVDFALSPQTESDKFKMVVLGDPQVLDERELGFFRKGIIEEIENSQDVVMGLTMGDIVQNDLDLTKNYNKTIAQVGVPWYNVIGNHDLNMDAPADSLNDETFESYFGPSTYSFNYAKAHFIVINNNRYPDPRDGKGLWAGYTQEQLQFIENDLKFVNKGQLVIIANHIQMNIVNENSYRIADRQKLFNLLNGYSNVLVLSAHTHHNQQFFYGKEDGWPNENKLHEYNVGATCGNWYSGRINERGIAESDMSDGTPQGYVYLIVDGNKYAADYKVSGKPSDYQIRLFHRKTLGTIWWEGRGRIYANFFMGHKKSNVEYRIDDDKWRPMRYTLQPDPAYIAELYRWDTADSLFSGRRPTEAADCTHLWWAPLPNKRSLGIHRIQVRATDDYGRVFVEESKYEIKEPSL